MASLALAEKVKFGVLSDIHLQPYYNPKIPQVSPAGDQYWCVPQEDFVWYTDPVEANFGRLGCDLPALMIVRGFEKMSAENSDINFILVPGDFVGHELSMDFEEDVSFKDSQNHYDELKSVHNQVSLLFETYFKDVPVLMTLGNNDTKYHYQPPFGLNK